MRTESKFEITLLRHVACDVERLEVVVRGQGISGAVWPSLQGVANLWPTHRPLAQGEQEAQNPNLHQYL